MSRFEKRSTVMGSRDTRETKFEDYLQHFSPRRLAEYHHEHDIGKDCETHGQVWDAPPDLIRNGLLHLILTELRKITKVDDRMSDHVHYLKADYLSDDIELLDAVKENMQRVREMLEPKLGFELTLGRSDLGWIYDIHEMGEMYAEDYEDHYQVRKGLRERLERLKSVTCLEEVDRLQGVSLQSSTETEPTNAE